MVVAHLVLLVTACTGFRPCPCTPTPLPFYSPHYDGFCWGCSEGGPGGQVGDAESGGGDQRVGGGAGDRLSHVAYCDCLDLKLFPCNIVKK